MKVVHIVGGVLSGGAARGAYWLHRELLNAGVDSILLINDIDNNNDPSVVNLKKVKMNKCSSVRLKLEQLFIRVLYKVNAMFSLSVIPSFIHINSIIKDADVINLHWVNDGVISLYDIYKMDKPLIWTIRDMWPITGGCHYSLGCKKYTNACGECPILNSKNEKDLSTVMLNIKGKLVRRKKIVGVGISSWTTKEAMKSTIFRDNKVVTIPNFIDVNVFLNRRKNEARYKFNIPKEDKVILFGSQNPKDFYKGFDLLLDIIKNIGSEFTIVSFGKKVFEKLDNNKLNVIELGFINDDEQLSYIYSLADVFIAPSRCETFGKTIAEAMSCNIPAVAFNYSGPKDIITHKVNGYLAEPYDIFDFCHGIKWVLDESNILSEPRDHIKSNFSAANVTNKYIELYNEML
ncbi:glycosyltransferase [Photobacterium leiognathi]|uniref:glycosyltransferase n=1 Tax=Photobacterium leiognathi TaxID=553611 RepID=UPI002981A5B3|nr:glycosyltransferase [Photobacterium leiognathi]